MIISFDKGGRVIMDDKLLVILLNNIKSILRILDAYLIRQ